MRLYEELLQFERYSAFSEKRVYSFAVKRRHFRLSANLNIFIIERARSEAYSMSKAGL